MPTSSNAAHPWANNINQTLSNIAVQQSPLTHWVDSLSAHQKHARSPNFQFHLQQQQRKQWEECEKLQPKRGQHEVCITRHSWPGFRSMTFDSAWTAMLSFWVDSEHFAAIKQHKDITKSVRGIGNFLYWQFETWGHQSSLLALSGSYNIIRISYKSASQQEKQFVK
jgi:hypothetical protein